MEKFADPSMWLDGFYQCSKKDKASFRYKTDAFKRKTALSAVWLVEKMQKPDFREWPEYNDRSLWYESLWYESKLTGFSNCQLQVLSENTKIVGWVRYDGMWLDGFYRLDKNQLTGTSHFQKIKNYRP